ncbi:hypothetical protein A2803_01690 [Candidatus Woesebacteria bacterium RIFCSPHIGHO2_01_FULL_44_21]|uniref:Sodium/calcium exchanger membrane region domain-containing protein n=1 Tax=Candidatus Woesebacteria bacterium RIFCSPHIGHO2_01_FULL_44_21 TaxID=1802503 RepID=A0A1F7YWU1_9BACT|nr:MAG: hypothetical protein A2803_01690 [Candidatus Woesebacteria bacterium RIFCSPHIGHO2_01_FULL_44_21]OGM69585.1 MAG: hypothetical protein A2897_03205 [Candidatus Woesebacteria bacterium RIFCSPLOWO2_01_FULL_44_24b]
MNELTFDLAIYITSFFVIWAGSGLIVSAVSKLSQRLHVPAFLVSFVVLGILTSTPEMAVGLSAVSSGTPSIFVGNLLGGIPVIFLLIIPLLAILGRGIKLNHGLGQNSILLALAIAVAPFVAVLDHEVNNQEGVILIGAYFVVVLLLHRNNVVTKHNVNLLKLKSYTFIDILKVLAGTGIVLFSSNIIVSKTLYFSGVLNIAPFYISLIVLSLGTNLPELTIAIRAIITGRKDIAFGDYLGSAAANTVLFGVFTLMTKDAVIEVDSFLVMFVLVVTGLALFYHFSKTKHTISPKEGLGLLAIYIIFVLLELFGSTS